MNLHLLTDPSYQVNLAEPGDKRLPPTVSQAFRGAPTFGSGPPPPRPARCSIWQPASKGAESLWEKVPADRCREASALPTGCRTAK